MTRKPNPLLVMALAFAIALALLPVPGALASTSEIEEPASRTTPRGSDPAETLKKVAADVVEPQLGRPSDRVIDAKTPEDLPELQDPSPDPVPVPDAVKDLPVKAAQPWEADTEIIQERTETSKTFRAEEPGRFKQKIYAEPVHFKDGNSWREIKEQLVESTTDDTKRKNKANSFGLQVAERADDPDLATVELDKNHSVAFGMQGAAGVTGKVAGNTITYSKVNRHTDVKLTSEKKGLKEELILSSPKAPDEFVFPLKLKGLTASINEHGEVIFTDAAGKARAITPHGFMYDSNVDPRSDEPAMSMGVTYELVKHSNGQALVVKLDRKFLDDPATVWPVTVDPVIYPLNAKVDDTYVMKPFNRDNSHDPELKVGTYDGGAHTARSFMHFDTSALVGKKIDLAYFYMLEKHSYNCSYPPGNVYRVGDDSWQGSAIRTWPGPAVVGSGIPGTWYGAECHNRMAYWTVTDLVQQWANSGSANGSLSTWGSSETNSNYWKKYKSSEVGGAPFMYIEYSAGDPFGYLDYVANVPGVGNGAGQIYVSGWGIDPDTTGAIEAHAYAGPSGQPMAWGVPLLANLNRPDVGQAYPAYGPNHGYQGNITVPGPGTYDVCVALINVGQGTTKWLPCQSITVTNAPSVPTNAAATGNSDGSVSVSWGHPTQNGGSSVHLYNVLATYQDGSVATNKTCNYPCTSVKFTALTLGTSYKFYVFALNSVAYSPPAAAGTVVPATKPGAPTNVSGTGGATVAEVSWTPPQSNGSPITKVIVTATGEGITKTVTCQDATCLAANKVLVPDLAAGTYTFVAKAVNAVGTGPSSGSTSAVNVLGLDALKPTNVSATAGDQEATVTWSAPAVSLPTLTGYVVKTFDAADDSLLATSEPTTDAHLTVEGLNNGRAVYFKVTATTLIVSAESEASNQVTPAGVPVPVGSVTANGGDREATVEWEPFDNNGNPITNYTITTRRAENNENVQTEESLVSPHTVTGLQNGTSYYFEVTGSNGVGPGTTATSDPVWPSGLPFAPTNLAASNIASRSAVLFWDAPGDRSDGTPGDNGSSISGYEVTIVPVCSGCSGLDTNDANTVIEGLDPGMTYFFRVSSVNANGTSELSESVEIRTDNAPPTAPRNVAGSAGDESAILQWDPPADLHGSTLIGYEVHLTPQCQQCSGLIISDPQVQRAEVNGLTNDIEYSVQISATTPEGYGEFSDPILIVAHKPTYAALGDSFSSGQGAPGNPPYDWDSDEVCKRSRLAYAPLFVNKPLVEFDDVQFLACAGAVISEVAEQIALIEGSPDLITLTAGGNDAHFADVLLSCGRSSACHEDPVYANLADEITALEDDLVVLYGAAKNRATADGAQVMVFEYPQLFGDEQVNQCLNALGFEVSERVWIRALTSHMNDVIQSAADEVGVAVLELVGSTPDGGSPADPGPFDGHEICSGDEYLNGLTFVDSKYFHPNDRGYEVMAELLEQAWGSR